MKLNRFIDVLIQVLLDFRLPRLFFVVGQLAQDGGSRLMRVSHAWTNRLDMPHDASLAQFFFGWSR